MSTAPTTGTSSALPCASNMTLANAASTHSACRTNLVTRLGLSQTTANVTILAFPRATSPLHTLHRALPVGATEMLYRFGCAFIPPRFDRQGTPLMLVALTAPSAPALPHLLNHSSLSALLLANSCASGCHGRYAGSVTATRHDSKQEGPTMATALATGGALIASRAR